MKQYAIGDIHGQLEKLDALVSCIPADAELIFLGDYLDKGPHSRRVIDRLIKLTQERSCRFLIGNHEFVWLEQMNSGGRSDFIRKFGGEATLQSYGEPTLNLDDRVSIKAMFGDHVEFMKNLESFVITDHAVCVHGGIDPAFNGDDLTDHDIEKLVFLRFRRNARKTGWQGKTVVCGHDNLGTTPTMEGHAIDIDTGAWQQDGRLTALNLQNFSYIQDNGKSGKVGILET